jgi:hypothetical protein
VNSAPPDLRALDDLESVIVEFIGRAEYYLDIAVQELDSEPIAQALLDATYPDVKVRMFVEQDYVMAGKPPVIQQDLGQTEVEQLPRADPMSVDLVLPAPV